MARVAIIVGISDYVRESNLPCCTADADSIAEFVRSTSRFDHVEVIKNATASQIRERMREALPSALSELFFYFSGHGSMSEFGSFLCASDFDAKRPNETGISRQDLLQMLRSADPDLVVMVLDACHSGSALIKSSEEFAQIPKGILRNVVQIAACMEDQVSYTGRPLSSFTDKFLHALIRKEEGSIYYSDVINTLRDDYRESSSQVPHFVQQGTFRDLIVEDARQLKTFSAYLKTLFADVKLPTVEVSMDSPAEPSLLDRLAKVDALLVRRDVLEAEVEKFFASLDENLSIGEFNDMYDLEITAHTSYVESSSIAFMTRCLAKEVRPDRFVSAELKVKKSPARHLMGFTTMFLDADEKAIETYDLVLNYPLSKAQVRFSFIPKFLALQQINLVVSVAPSLNHCYIFEVVTEHARIDFDRFESDGKEVTRRWYRRRWDSNFKGILNDITEKLKDVAKSHIDSALVNPQKN